MLNRVYILTVLHMLSSHILLRQAALERQDLSCTYLAHHELESVVIVMIFILS